MRYWILKSDPDAYSWENLLKDRKTPWDGVRNYQARNNIRAMRIGDLAYFYHSVTERAIVGTVRVVSEPYQDPTIDDDRWSAVDVEIVRSLPKPVSLDAIKGESSLAGIALLKQSRLSVIPLTKAEFKRILKLAEELPFETK